MVDVLIQTHNEELNLEHTLLSVRGWTNRVFVVDSGSTDRTVNIAERLNATVCHHPWEGYAAQKNWALNSLPFQSPWVLILDADEAVSPELRDQITSIVGKPVDQVSEAGFLINRVFVFMGRRIHHCGYFPSWNLRLFKHGRAMYEDRLVHEHMVVDGPVGSLGRKNLLIHEDRRGLEHFFAKHNRYSTLEAQEIFERPERWPGLWRLFGDRVVRRRFGKSRLLPHLPLPWVWRFLYMYVGRLGFLDGSAGWMLCNFISGYEFQVQLKLRALRRKAKVRSQGSGLARREGELDQRLAPRSRRGGTLVADDAIDPVDPIDPVETPHPRDRPTPVDTPEVPPADTRRNGSAHQPLSVPVGPPVADATPGGPGHDQPHPHTPHAKALAEGRWHAFSDKADAEVVRRTSPWTFKQNMTRVLWMVVWALLFRTSFHNWYRWRRVLLRLFGGKVGRNVRLRPSVRIEIPWNLDLGDDCIVGDDAILYSLGPIKVGKRVVISQYAHLCAGTHDYRYPDFPLVRPPITVGDDVWIAADAFVGPGVTVGDRAIVGARSSAFHDLPPDMIAAGNPARPIKPRELLAGGESTPTPVAPSDPVSM